MVAHSEFRNFPAGLMNQLFSTSTSMKSNFHNKLAFKRIFEFVFLHFRQQPFSCTFLFSFSRVHLAPFSLSLSLFLIISVKIYVFKHESRHGFETFPGLVCTLIIQTDRLSWK